MQAFIKNKKSLIVNSQILDNEKQDLIDFVLSAATNGVDIIKLYNTEGDLAGIEFKTK